jgi:HD-GYP domain-containing protein (c-di-GMP phosphodiesterase class II)
MSGVSTTRSSDTPRTGGREAFASLGAVLNRVVVGEPLPLDIYDKEQVLLLANGNVVESARQLQLLVERGGLVLLKEVTDPFQVVLHAPRAQLPEVWSSIRQRVTQLLSSADEPQLENRMQAALPLVQTLIERDPDLAIFQIIRQSKAERGAYGSLQAMQTSALAMMLANRLGWMGGMIDLAAKCALTMNLSILESMSPVFLQSDQRNHPTRSREILQNAGITDPDWLEAVERHHERPDGSGYPRGITEVNEASQLVQCVEVFVEGLGRAAGHSAVTATGLLRQMYLEAPKSTFVAVLIKELGIYPPGSIVRLDNGEIGMVVQRGLTTTAPLVAVLDPDWSVPPEPRIRDTASANYAVIGVLPPRDGRGREAATAEEAWDRAIAALPQAAPAVNEEPDQV